MADKPILVLGATGRTGRLLVAELERRGAGVRALVRDPVRARESLGDRVDCVAGDLRNRNDLAKAAAGIERIIFVAAAYGDTARGSPRDIDYGAVRSLIEILDESVVDRVVLLSSAGTTQPEHPHNCSFDSVLKWKYRGEDVLRRSGLRHMIVRALGLRDRPGGQQGIRLVQGDRIAFGEDIARADVATFLAAVIAPEKSGPVPLVPGFDPAFQSASLQGATFEIYNDATIDGSLWVSGAAALVPDCAATLPN